MLPLRYGNLTWWRETEKERVESLIWPNSAFNIYISYPSQFLSFLFVVADCLPIDYIDNTQRKQSSSLWTDPQGSGRRISKVCPFRGATAGIQAGQDGHQWMALRTLTKELEGATREKQQKQRCFWSTVLVPHLFSIAVVTNYHKFNGLKNTRLLFCGFVGQKSRHRVA